tara:strand:+ start:959 stop:1480 length:522 start_codon:yes stop_codon:yes gene_type:complete
MKRLLLAPLLLGLMSPTALMAEEEYHKCLALGKRECAIKQLVIGTCATMFLTNEGRSDEDVSQGSMFVYNKYGKDVGFTPNEKQRRGNKEMTDAEIDELSLIVKARMMSSCPNVFNKYAANSYLKYRKERRKENKPYKITYDEHVENLHWIEYLMFEMKVGLWEIFAEKQKQK